MFLIRNQKSSGTYFFPTWRSGYQNSDLGSTTTKPSTYSIYNLHKLNPAYWFNNNPEEDKLDKLYELVKCVIEDEAAADCQQKLQSSRKIFERKNTKKEVVNQTTTTQASGVSSTTVKNVSVQNKNQENSQIKNSSLPQTSAVTETIESTTLSGNSSVVVSE